MSKKQKSLAVLASVFLMLFTIAPVSNVINPPCASKIAWKINTMIPKILVTHGPNKIAPRPVPVIWEQLPVTEGIFKRERYRSKRGRLS